MKGIVLRKQQKDMFYTDMNIIFEALGNIETQYNWLITDYECNYYSNPITLENRHDYIWISGNELSKFVKDNDIQFVWGTFTAFDKEITFKDITSYELLKSMVRVFKNKNVELQHPLSSMEIISCDSSQVIIISKEEQYINSFFKQFPMSEDLIEYID